jgi:histidine kinase
VGKGTGLGLSISYGIVKDCRGQIRADSFPGKGALFTVSFPAACPDSAGGIILTRGTNDDGNANWG